MNVGPGKDQETPYGCFRLRVARRHVDLRRVSSALCPGL
ncbi:putative leader peptide [Jatrophihabitans sp. DSM 45814]